MYPRVPFHTPSWLACGEQPLCKTHIAGRVSCSGQIISLRRFDKVSGGSQWSGGFYGYRLKFWLFYGYRLIFFSYG